MDLDSGNYASLLCDKLVRYFAYLRPVSQLTHFDWPRVPSLLVVRDGNCCLMICIETTGNLDNRVQSTEYKHMYVTTTKTTHIMRTVTSITTDSLHTNISDNISPIKGVLTMAAYNPPTDITES